MAIASWLLGTVGFYLLAGLVLFLLQKKLLYPAGRGRPDLSEVAGEPPQIVAVAGETGPLTGWYWPAAPGQLTLLYFQGNAGHIGHRANKLLALREGGLGLLLAGYRGYGGNPGTGSEAGLIDDGRRALQWLRERQTPVVLFGESLGSGVAMALAGEAGVVGVILEAPFDSIAQVAQRRYPLFPAAALLREKWDSLARATGVTCPILVIHGTGDRVVPLDHGQRLFAALPQPKTLLIIEGAGHGDLWDFPGTEAGARRFLASLAPG